MRFSRLWVAAGVLAIVVYYLLPAGTAANSVYDGIGIASGLAILAAVRWHRPARAALWYCFAAGQLTWVGGDILFTAYESRYPSPADALYLAAYPMLGAGLLMLLRGRIGRDAARLVDAAVLATGLGLVFWVFVLHPVATGDADSLLERIISTAYPAADALLLALLAGLFTSAGTRTPTARMLGWATVSLLAADISYSLLNRYSAYDGRAVDWLWLLSYVMWAAAALHPSMRTPAGEPASLPAPGMRRRRLVLLAASSLLAPAMLFVPGVGADQVDRLAIGFGAVVLFLLVVLRMGGFVKETQRQAGQLAELAMRDDLTGLANRRRFEQSLRDALVSGRPHVVLLDLDAFKSVNDELGHSVGDRLLGALAERLSAAVSDGSLVARMGGDEFAVLIPDTDAVGAMDVVDRVVAALHEPIRAGQHELLVNASIGLTASTGTTDPFEVLRRADIAMYAAKDPGEPFRWYVPELDRQAGEEAKIGAELRTALDAGQFRLVYQPIVSLPDGRIVSAEALVRWEHPERGLVPPIDFIPVAEHNGLIVELGAWILVAACRQMSRWRTELGPDAPGRISVNVSARQLARPGFAKVVAAALRECGMPAHCLAVEVTETAVFEGGRALDTLHELHALGVRIALDDFGTGHSSLTLLQTVPVDILKVDKSFVDNITMAGQHAVIATALIQVSTGLGLDAVAEGVESAEQAAELHRLGYRLAQGYHFGKPAAELPVFVGGRR
jgi:diguanylate cyclase (GGDEF)-like protein